MISWSRLKVWAADPGDGGLARAAARGDRRAFDALVHAYQRPLHGFLLRRVGPGIAEDVLQETWLAAWAALPGFACRSRFKAWLFGIAVHKAADAQRAGGRAGGSWSDTASWSDIADDLPAAGPDPFAAADLRHSVRAALAGLPPPQREVLELYYYAELTLPEIADTLGRNLNTVKYHFYQAHAKAADGLRDYGPAPEGGRS